ncbi:uncharacterized protein LOC143961338 [Lithobates pipiens]
MMTTAMCPLRVLLLWALLCPGRGNVQEEIFTRPGSDLLIPIRIHLTLNHTDTRRCDGIEWRYKPPTRDESSRIFQHRGCTLRKPENTTLPNIRLSENGSLIISNVTPENDGMYSVEIHNSTGHRIQTDYYTVHVEVPVSGPDLNVSCLQNGIAEISCRVEEGTKPNISLSVIGGSQERYSTSANNITAIVGSPGPWNITCTVENGVSRSEESRAGVTCPVPLSDITVNHTCFPDGSAEAECSVKGSDPRYSWSLDGRSVSSHRRVTLHPPVSGTLHCDVINTINNLSRSINIFCAEVRLGTLTGLLPSGDQSSYPLETGALTLWRPELLPSGDRALTLWRPGSYPLETGLLPSGDRSSYPLKTGLLNSGDQTLTLWRPGSYPLKTGLLPSED